MNSITQDMKYRQSLLAYAQKYGVSRASRKYNKSRSYIYFWRARYDGSLQSLACRSRRPHSHPNHHTREELNLIADMYAPTESRAGDRGAVGADAEMRICTDRGKFGG